MRELHDADDHLERALHEDARGWREHQAPPSLDDAVRRLDLPGAQSPPAAWPSPSRRPAGVAIESGWRPLAVAAAVLLLVGGVVGATGASLRARDAEPADRSPLVGAPQVPSPTVPATTTSATGTSTEPSGASRPGVLPDGLVERGRSLHREGTVPVVRAEVVDRSATTLDVVVPWSPWGETDSTCLVPLHRASVLAETATEIQVEVGSYWDDVTSSTPTRCPDLVRLGFVGTLDDDSPVTLAAPLGSRVVRDVSTGEVVTVRVGGVTPRS